MFDELTVCRLEELQENAGQNGRLRISLRRSAE